MTAVKVCGLTREEDVALACSLGATAVGFNFAAESPRRVSLETARRLAQQTAPGVLRVGVFVHEDPGTIREAAQAARLDAAQLHRPLREEDLIRLGIPIIAVVRVGPAGADPPPPALLARCRAILFDTFAADRAGGTGKTFEWRTVAGRDFGAPVLLAGGLDPANVGAAVRAARPWGVDAASGLESCPGWKDAEKMTQFFRAVREADAG